jgi:periplasmic protein TonB
MEAARVVKLMPKWIPGTQHGRNVRVWYTLPINFMPQNQN